jgi:hypothetical protein
MQTSCSINIPAGVTLSATQKINVQVVGNAHHAGTWSLTYSQP